MLELLLAGNGEMQMHIFFFLLTEHISHTYTLVHRLSVSHNTCLSTHLMFQHWQSRTPCGLAPLNKPVSYLPVLGEEVIGTLCT